MGVAKKPRKQHKLLPAESEGRRSSEGTRAGGLSRFSEEKDEKEVLGKSEKGVTCLQWGPACLCVTGVCVRSFLLVTSPAEGCLPFKIVKLSATEGEVVVVLVVL